MSDYNCGRLSHSPASKSGARYAATLIFPAHYTIRNVPEKSQLLDIDRTLHQSQSHRTDAISKRVAKRGM